MGMRQRPVAPDEIRSVKRKCHTRDRASCDPSGRPANVDALPVVSPPANILAHFQCAGNARSAWEVSLAVSIEFTEEMKGFVTFGETDYQPGREEGEKKNSTLMFHLRITLEDVTRF